MHDVAVGDRVVLNGAGVGETRHGGWPSRRRRRRRRSSRCRTAIGDGFAAAIGTAGFTAMLSVLALERIVAPGDGPVLVTGASGGVGSVAIALLAARGYRVTASTGRAGERRLAPAPRRDGRRRPGELAEPGRPMQRRRWAGAVDSVGGQPWRTCSRQTRWGGAVTACGLAQDTDLPTTVLPFILRGVSLLGIDSVDAPLELRRRAWDALAADLDPALLAG